MASTGVGLPVATAMELAGHDAEVDRRIGSFFKAMKARVADALSRAKAAGKFWPMVLSLQVPPEFSSVSSRGCEWSVKRHRPGSRRKPPLTLYLDRFIW